ncbi:MAG: hypothetical protein ACRDLF_07695 [Solirubrobacteraceae bacterium]
MVVGLVEDAADGVEAAGEGLEAVADSWFEGGEGWLTGALVDGDGLAASTPLVAVSATGDAVCPAS